MRASPFLLIPLILTVGCEVMQGIAPDLYGRVTIDGQPAAAITVRASSQSRQFTVQTNADGRYHFSQLPRDSFTVTIAGYPANVLFANNVQGARLTGESRFELNFTGVGPVEVRGYLLWAYAPRRGAVPLPPPPSLALPGVAVRIEGSPFPVAGAVTTEAGFYRLTGAPGLGEFSVVFGALPAGLGYDPNSDHLVRASSRRGVVDTTYAVYQPSAQLDVYIMVDGEPSSNADVHLATPLPITSRANYFNNLPVLPVDVRISGFPAAIQFSTTLRTIQLGVKDTVVFTGYTPGANRPPVVTITAPQNGASFALGTPITFRGNAVDPEDGALTGSALEWYEPGIGDIGTGESVTTSSLPLGPHRIILRASDRNGASTSALLDITIVPVTTGKITGTVTVYDHGYHGARLTLSTTPVRSATTDAQGVYLFDNVPAGTYVLSLEPPQYTSFPFTTRSVTVKAGATETINFAGNIGSPAPQSPPR